MSSKEGDTIHRWPTPGGIPWLRSRSHLGKERFRERCTASLQTKELGTSKSSQKALLYVCMSLLHTSESGSTAKWWNNSQIDLTRYCVKIIVWSVESSRAETYPGRCSRGAEEEERATTSYNQLLPEGRSPLITSAYIGPANKPKGRSYPSRSSYRPWWCSTTRDLPT